MLPSISATAARVESPRPSETSISGVEVPGRWRFAQPEGAPRDGRTPAHARRDASAASRRGGTGSACRSPRHRTRPRIVCPARWQPVSAISRPPSSAVTAMILPPCLTRRGQQGVSEQRSAGDLHGAGQRPEREGGGGEHAVQCGERQRAREDAGDERHGQDAVEQSAPKQRHPPAPATTPIKMPASESRPTWIRAYREDEGAAMRRGSGAWRCCGRGPPARARTPLATPMPPTSSEVSPTRVMNRLVLSTNCTTPGCGIVRLAEPPAGVRKRLPDRVDEARGGGAPCGTIARSRYSTSAPGLSSPACARLAAERSARARTQDGGCGDPIRLVGQHTRHMQEQIAEADRGRRRAGSAGRATIFSTANAAVRECGRTALRRGRTSPPPPVATRRPPPSVPRVRGLRRCRAARSAWSAA